MQAWSTKGSPMAFLSYNGIGSNHGSPLHAHLLASSRGHGSPSPTKGSFKSPTKSPLMERLLNGQGLGKGITSPTNILANAFTPSSSSSALLMTGPEVSNDVDEQGQKQGQERSQGQGARQGSVLGSTQGPGQQIEVNVIASDVEKEFMKRQLHHTVTASDNNGNKHLSLAHATQQLSQQQLSQQQLSQQSLSSSQTQSSTTVGGVFSELTNVLQDRLVVLEKQVP